MGAMGDVIQSQHAGTGTAVVALSGGLKKGAMVEIEVEFTVPSYMSYDWLRKNLLVSF
jgi:hypothetical protein